MTFSVKKCPPRAWWGSGIHPVSAPRATARRAGQQCRQAARAAEAEEALIRPSQSRLTREGSRLARGPAPHSVSGRLDSPPAPAAPASTDRSCHPSRGHPLQPSPPTGTEQGPLPQALDLVTHRDCRRDHGLRCLKEREDVESSGNHRGAEPLGGGAFGLAGWVVGRSGGARVRGVLAGRGFGGGCEGHGKEKVSMVMCSYEKEFGGRSRMRIWPSVVCRL